VTFIDAVFDKVGIGVGVDTGIGLLITLIPNIGELYD
jgi:hypothetical protein